jgi:transketolase
MRDAFSKTLTALAREDERVVLLSGDIGNRMYDGLKKVCSDRFYNCGVAEANMTGVAAGMAMCGLRPFTYTIAPFVTTRCLEQIRVDVCYHNLPVTIVAVGAGYSYASLGATHHACEDIAFLRALPHMKVICPGDAVEVRQAVKAILKQDSPVYLRLGKKGEPVVHQEPPDFKIGKGIVLREGSEVCLLNTGITLPIAVDAGRELEKRGISTKVVSLHTVKPLDTELLEEVFSLFSVVTTIEEHSLIGGLGGAVAEWLADQPKLKARMCRIGSPDAFWHQAGDQGYVREQLGLTAQSIADRTVAMLEGKTP